MKKTSSPKLVGKGEGGPDPHLPPWPEWSDAFVRTVTWSGKKPVKKSFNSSASTTSGRSQIHSAAEMEREMLYEDPAGLVEMPEDIPVVLWERPYHNYTSSSFVLEPDVLPLDVLTHNRHLMEFKIMRMILGSMACIEREAFLRPFPVEFQSSHFVAPGPLWRPWHHVYCVGPQTHNLQYNKSGKYLVRLFYLGKWRRLTVDDLLPLDCEGRLLLPISRPDNLWLPILSKALLRVAAVSHGADFSVVHCLTAWVPTSLLCKGCSQYQLWGVCCQLMATTDDITHSPGCCHSQHSVISCPPDASVENLDAVGSRVIFGMILHPSRTVIPSASISTLESMVLVSNVRYNNERPSPQWKEYRWKEWAFNNGIIPDIKSTPFRNVQIYNPLELSDLPSPDQVPEVKSDETKADYWLNFEVFISVTRALEVYYKPSYFKFSLRAWSLPELTQKISCAEDVVVSGRGRKASKEMGRKGDAKSKSKGKSPEANKSGAAPKSQETEKTKGAKGKGAKDKRVSFIEWPLNLNTPSFFYLLVDSLFCKQLYICLSAYDPEGPTYAHIYTGKFEWYSPTVAPLVFMLTTSATVGYTLALSPGLHVFRVWYQFPVHFCLQIYSNTTFTLGSKMYIQQMLSRHSESFQFYGDKISSAFECLLNAAEGGADHGSAYSQLVESLHPPQLREQLAWPHWLTAHTDLLQVFEESLVEMLAESIQFPGEVYQVLQTFQMLFLNPVFGEHTLSKVRSDYYDFIQQRRWSKRQKEILLEEELKQKLALAADTKGKNKSPKSDKAKKTGKESSKKGSVKSAKTVKTGKQKEAKGKVKAANKGEQLRKLLQCKEKSLLLGDHNQVIVMLKKMMTKVPYLKRLYPFRYEDDRRVVFQDYIGEVVVSEKWVVLVRCVMNLHSSEEVPCSLHIWCPLKKMLLRLIDNDTQQDVPLGFIENNVANLIKNIGGYTLCVYGTADVPTVAWRLRSLGVSETDSLHICLGQECHNTHSQPPQQVQQTLHGFYVPNKDSLITRCLLEAYTAVTVMLRLGLSSSSAVCSFTIVDEVGIPVLNTSGVGHIIIPVLKLQGSDWQERRTSSTGPSIYTLEVRLLHSSWPLSLDQKKAMLFYKEHLPEIQLNPQVNNFEEEYSSDKTPIENLDFNFFEEVDKPSWSLTLVTDSQQVMAVSIREDMTLFDHLSELKSKWEEEGKDPSLCQQLRQDFITQSTEAEEDMSEEAMFHLKAKKTEELTKLHGRQTSLPSLSSDQRHHSSLLESSRESGDKLSTISLHSQSSASQLSASTTGTAKGLSGEQQVEGSSDKNMEGDHKNMLVQQAGIHKALTDLRIKNMERLQEVFEQTALLRAQLIGEMKAAKETESKKDKVKNKDKSPDKSKEKDSKKPTKIKGK